MKSTVSVSEGQDTFPALIKAAEKGKVVTVTRHDEPVACVIGHERMSAIAETLEIMTVSLGAGTTESGGFIRPHQPEPEPEQEKAHDHAHH